MKITLSHPGTPPHAQQAVRAYLESGLLERFHTTFVYRRDAFSGKLLRSLYGLFARDADSQLGRRALEGIPPACVATHPWREALRTASTHWMGLSAQDRIWEWMELDFDRRVAACDWGPSEAVHGYEFACLETFRAAKRRGVATIYEMPSPFFGTVERILAREYALHPELESRPSRNLARRAPGRNRRKERELELADFVVCNSEFSRRSILEAGFPAQRVIKIPLGMPRPVEAGVAPRGGKPMFLYAGTLSVRKGVHYLLEAWRRLSPSREVELRLVGALDVPASLLEGLPGKVTVGGSVPRAELSRLYQEASLLIFPTLCDGFGMVLTEALAHGLPVLTTPSAGASDFIRPGGNGFVVPAGDVEALAETLGRCIDDLDGLWAMREACLETSRAWQWSDYRGKLVSEVRRRLPEREPAHPS